MWRSLQADANLHEKFLLSWYERNIPDELFEVIFISTIFIHTKDFFIRKTFSVDFFLLIFDLQIFYIIENSALLHF